MMATANSKIISRIRSSVGSKNRAGAILVVVRAAVEISWSRRWPAVKLAVSRTPRAIGRINRLIDSMIMRVGINKAGVPSGNRCAMDLVGCVRRPVNTVASQSGSARAMFTESWVVGVNV